jgi:RNA polymerase sigma-70 factor (ECF subfamily)
MAKINGAQWATSLGRVAVDHYGDRLHRFLLKRLGRQEAEDVAQEVYVRLMHVPYSDFIRNPEAYIFSVARQVAAEFSRQRQRQRARVSMDSEQLERLVEHPEEICPDEVARSVSSTQLLQSFLEQLPPEQAAAILLYERDGYSYAEIAETLEVSERAVQRYLLKARERLQQLLMSDQEETRKMLP